MVRKGYTPEQIINKLREAEVLLSQGNTIGVACKKIGVRSEAPASACQVNTKTKPIIQKGVPPMVSPFDENALEAALRLKDAHQAKITVLSIGRNLSKAVLRKYLATGIVLMRNCDQ